MAHRNARWRMDNKTPAFLARYISLHQNALDELHAKTANDFARWVDQGVQVLKSGKKILFFGNGGSAAEAQHIAAELSIKYMKERKALAALALNVDPSAVTAAGNDYGYDQIFVRQIMALGQPGDMAIGYSTSGKSPNIVKALDQARTQKMIAVGLTGTRGAEMKNHCDVCIVAPSELTPHVQEMHNILGHAFCAAIEDGLGLVSYGDSPWKI